MLESKKMEEAATWFELWNRGYPDDPGLEVYREQIELIKIFLGVNKRF